MPLLNNIARSVPVCDFNEQPNYWNQLQKGIQAEFSGVALMLSLLIHALGVLFKLLSYCILFIVRVCAWLDGGESIFLSPHYYYSSSAKEGGYVNWEWLQKGEAITNLRRHTQREKEFCSTWERSWKWYMIYLYHSARAENCWSHSSFISRLPCITSRAAHVWHHPRLAPLGIASDCNDKHLAYYNHSLTSLSTYSMYNMCVCVFIELVSGRTKPRFTGFTISNISHSF